MVSLRVIPGNAGGANTDAQPERSLVAYLKTGDSSVVLLPGAQQQITCEASLPAALPQGEYWARIVVAWTAGEQQAGADSADGSSSVIGVVYRKGEAFADVKLVSAGGTRESDGVHFYVDLIPLGNAAYRGNMLVDIKNTRNKIVYTTHRPVDIYDRQRQVLDIKDKSMPPGRYKAIIRFNTEREDLGNEALPVLPKEYKIDFNMP